jgi:hypothetical protein
MRWLATLAAYPGDGSRGSAGIARSTAAPARTGGSPTYIAMDAADDAMHLPGDVGGTSS